MDLHLKNKLVLVTGSTLGIGYAIAKKYAELGADVIVNGRDEKKVHETIQKIEKLKVSGKLHGIVADLSNSKSSQELVEKVNKIGPLDILINNVGIFEAKKFTDVTDEDWAHILNTNVISAVRMCRAFMPKMLERNTGSIIFIASEASLTPQQYFIHYSTTKTALLGLSRGLAEMTKGTKVRVNTVSPGPTWTEGVEEYVKGLAKLNGITVEAQKSKFFQEIQPTSLIQRFIEPEEVANAVVFFSSDLAAIISGSHHLCEGGIVKHI